MVVCKKWVLAKAFEGEVKPENFRLEEEELSESIKDGGMYNVHVLQEGGGGHMSINVPSIAKFVASFYKCSPIFFAIWVYNVFWILILSHDFMTLFLLTKCC